MFLSLLSKGNGLYLLFVGRELCVCECEGSGGLGEYGKWGITPTPPPPTNNDILYRCLLGGGGVVCSYMYAQSYA